MENKKATELMSRKRTLKSKLMAAVSMLLVSAIMVSVTTYAWFILSTAPEVKGMSTTVGSNGALEMALVDYAGDNLNDILNNQIKTSVGDSNALAGKAVEDSNRTWGNLVDLSGKYYGLTSDDMTLYPAALNMNSSDNGKIGDMSSMLKYAAYGTDGRVAELKGDTFAAKYDTKTANFQGYDGNSYGVRAIGTGTNADPIAAGLAAAKRNYNNAVAAVKSIAEVSLNNHGQKMAAMAVKSKTSDSATYTNDDVETIRAAKTALQSSAEQIKLAVQYAYNAYMLSTSGAAAEGVDLSTIKTNLTNVDEMSSVLALIDKYDTLNSTLTQIEVPAAKTEGAFTWSEIEAAINALMDSKTLKLNGAQLEGSDIKEAAKAYLDDTANENQKALVEGLMNEPKISVTKGAYCDIANFVGEYVSAEFDLSIRNAIKASDATITIEVSDTAAATPYFTAATAKVEKLEAPNGSTQDKNVLNTAYGYVVDLAFRTNASDAKLLLSGAKSRVSGSNEEGVQGAGSTFTVTDGADAAKLAKALRVVFINTTNKTILGVAAMAAEPTTEGGNTYALHMYNYTITKDGAVELGEQKKTNPAGSDGTAEADDTIVALTGNTPMAISALVYIDGGAVDHAMDKVSGTMNLQFCTDADLQPMSYKNYAATPLTIADEVEKTVAVNNTAALPKVTMNGSEVSVTWTSGNEKIATIESNSNVKGVAAGEVTITATYKDNSGVHTGSYKLTVTAQG